MAIGSWKYHIILYKPKTLKPEDCIEAAGQYVEQLKQFFPSEWLDENSKNYDNYFYNVIKKLQNVYDIRKVNPADYMEDPTEKLSLAVMNLYNWGYVKKVLVEFNEYRPTVKEIIDRKNEANKIGLNEPSN